MKNTSNNQLFHNSVYFCIDIHMPIIAQIEESRDRGKKVVVAPGHPFLPMSAYLNR